LQQGDVNKTSFQTQKNNHELSLPAHELFIIKAAAGWFKALSHLLDDGTGSLSPS
jgi:hypothetical protein